ncbi:MAG: STAS/SEC14 domain-containing protein [Nocardioidaceae bacterium]
MTPGEFKHFPLDERDAAVAWAAGTEPAARRSSVGRTRQARAVRCGAKAVSRYETPVTAVGTVASRSCPILRLWRTRRSGGDDGPRAAGRQARTGARPARRGAARRGPPGQ